MNRLELANYVRPVQTAIENAQGSLTTLSLGPAHDEDYKLARYPLITPPLLVAARALAEQLADLLDRITSTHVP